MQKEVKPGVIAGAVVVLLVIVGFFFMKFAQPKPYPGMSAPQATARNGGAMEQMSKDKAVGRIPGATGQGMPEGIKGPPPGTNPMGGN